MFLAVLLGVASSAPAALAGQGEKPGEPDGPELTIWVDSGNQLPVRMALYSFVYGRGSGAANGNESYFPELTWKLEDKSYLTPEQFRQELARELEKGGGPDLVFMDEANGTDLYALMAEGKLLGLEESVTQEFLGYHGFDYLGGTLELGQMEGTQYVLPLFVQCPVVFGVRDALEEAGMAPDGYDTLGDFLEAALRASETSGKQVFEDARAVDWLEKYAMPQSSDGESLDGTEELRELLARVRERSGSETGFFGPYESMESGESLLSGCGFSQAPKMVQNVSLTGQERAVIMAVPAWDGKVRAAVTQAAAVNANTAHPKEAAALLRMFQSSFVNVGWVQEAYPAIGIDAYWKSYFWQQSIWLPLNCGAEASEYAAMAEEISDSSPAGRGFSACTRNAVTDAVYQAADSEPDTGSSSDVQKKDVLTVGVSSLGMGSLHPLYRWLSDVAGRFSSDRLHVQIVSVANDEVSLAFQQNDMERADAGLDVFLSFRQVFEDDGGGFGDLPADLTDYLGENGDGFEIMELSGKPKGLVYGIEKRKGKKDHQHVFVISDQCPLKEEAFAFCAAALKDEGYEQAVKEAGYEPVGME